MYATAGPNNTRGAIGSAGQSISPNYVNYGAFNGLSGAGAATNYAGRGLNPYVYGPDGGSSGDQGGGYSGPTGETIVNYTYGQNGAGPHAVTSRSNGDSFAYDDNGNMTSRTMDGVTWTQVFDAENRLVEVDDGTTETTYVYDGAGNRIKRIVDDGTTVTTTLYVAGMEITLEDSTETQRKIYYSAGGAFRIIGGDDAGLYFKHGDHLGSTSVLSASTGAKVADSDVLYAPFGEVRAGELSNLTDFSFTGQIVDRSSGDLMYYGARYYLPGLKRFISPDTIVPSVLNGQSLNRYTYVKNNPVNYVDPTGHCEPGEMACWIAAYIRDVIENGNFTPEDNGLDASEVIEKAKEAGFSVEEIVPALDSFGVTVNPTDGNADEQRMAALIAVTLIALRVNDELGNPDTELENTWKKVMGQESTITVVPNADDQNFKDNCNPAAGDVACNAGNLTTGSNIFVTLGGITGQDLGPGITPTMLLVHEFGHIFTNGMDENGENATDLFNGNPGLFNFYFDNNQGRKDVAMTIAKQKFPINVGGDMDKPSEATADAFANWVFGKVEAGVINPSFPDAPTFVDNFMNHIITTCASRPGHGCGYQD